MTNPDIYRDTQWRYNHDAEFRAIVDYMFQLAIQHGYTPGELKQAAFMAALKAGYCPDTALQPGKGVRK